MSNQQQQQQQQQQAQQQPEAPAPRLSDHLRDLRTLLGSLSNQIANLNATCQNVQNLVHTSLVAANTQIENLEAAIAQHLRQPPAPQPAAIAAAAPVRVSAAAASAPAVETNPFREPVAAAAAAAAPAQTPARPRAVPGNANNNQQQQATASTSATATNVRRFDVLNRRRILGTNFQLRKLGYALHTESSVITADGLDVNAITKVLDELDGIRLAQPHFMLHFNLFQAFGSLKRILRSDRLTADLLRLKERVWGKLQTYLDEFQMKNIGEDRVLVKEMHINLNNLYRVEPTLTCLIETSEQLDHLCRIQKHPMPLPPAVRRCFERCRVMRSVAEFRNGTNVCALVQAERRRASDESGETYDDVDAIVEVLFNDYVQSWFSWHLTFLADIRLVAGLPIASPSSSSATSSVAAGPMVDLMQPHKTERLRKQYRLRDFAAALYTKAEHICDGRHDAERLAECHAILSALDGMELKSHDLHLHPDIMSAIRMISNSPLPTDPTENALNKLVCRAHNKIRYILEVLFNFPRDKMNQMFSEIAAYRQPLDRIPHELIYLTTHRSQLDRMQAFVFDTPTISPAKQAVLDRCQAMQSVAEFKEATNISDLVTAALRSSQNGDCAEGEAVNAAIATIFTYVPVTTAWDVTLLNDLRLKDTPPAQDSNDEPASEEVALNANDGDDVLLDGSPAASDDLREGNEESPPVGDVSLEEAPASTVQAPLATGSRATRSTTSAPRGRARKSTEAAGPSSSAKRARATASATNTETDRMAIDDESDEDASAASSSGQSPRQSARLRRRTKSPKPSEDSSTSN